MYYGPPVPPPPPPRKPKPAWFVPLMVGISVLGVLCAGVLTWGGVRLVNGVNAAVERENDAVESRFEESPEPAVTGPRASSYPVREAQDLARVCEGWFYPRSPTFTGRKPPHQIQVAKVMTSGFGTRVVSSWVDVPSDLPKPVQEAWWPKQPAKTQLLACVDVVRTGGKLKSCEFDDPKSDITTATMKQAFYRVRLHEVATGKVLLDKQVTGEDEECPSFIMVGPDRTIYSDVDDRQLYEMLKKYVMQQ